MYTYGYALTGSFCTFEKTIKQIEKLVDEGINIIPIMSFNAYSLDTRFGKAKDFRDRIEKMVSIFVGTTKDTSTVIQQEEIEDYIWLTFDRAMSLLKFENDKNILSSAHEFLNKNNYI